MAPQDLPQPWYDLADAPGAEHFCRHCNRPYGSRAIAATCCGDDRDNASVLRTAGHRYVRGVWININQWRGFPVHLMIALSLAAVTNAVLALATEPSPVFELVDVVGVVFNAAVAAFTLSVYRAVGSIKVGG